MKILRRLIGKLLGLSSGHHMGVTYSKGGGRLVRGRVEIQTADGEWVDITKDVKSMELAKAAADVVDMTSEEAFAEVIRGLKKPYPYAEVNDQ